MASFRALSLAPVLLLLLPVLSAASESALSADEENPMMLPRVREAFRKHVSQYSADVAQPHTHGREMRESMTSSDVASYVKLADAKSWKPTAVVAKDGSGDFKTVQAAINALTAKQNRWKPTPMLLYVKKGSYVERVNIPKGLPELTMVGDAGQTVIVYSRRAGQIGPDGKPIETVGTPVMTNYADHFTMVNIIVRNSAPRPVPGALGYQAVAYRTQGNFSLAYNCSFYSYQDTLYAQRGLQLYYNCFIFGEIDFIFGYAKAIFYQSTIYMDALGYAGIAAHFRLNPFVDECFVIMNSTVTGRNQGFLGRAWGRYACTIFGYNQMDNVITPSGWDDFMVPGRRWSSFFAEYGNRGMGSNLDGRVWWQKVLSPQQVLFYLSLDYIDLASWMRELPLAPGTKVVKPTKPPPAPTKCIVTETNSFKRNRLCWLCCNKIRTSVSFKNCMHNCRKN